MLMSDMLKNNNNNNNNKTTTTTTVRPFNSLFSRTTWISQHQKGQTSLDLNKARDYGVWGCSDISWTICKQSAPRSRQITTPTPNHSIFTGRMPFLTPNQQCQSTEGTLAMCDCKTKDQKHFPAEL